MECRISTLSHDLRLRGQIYCEVGPEKPCNHIVVHESGNGPVCIWPTIRLYGNDGDSGVPNDKTRNRNGTMSSFQTSPVSECSILRAVYVSGGSEETVRQMLAFSIGIGALNLV
ncbi:hypothetical protein TNCV_1128231 [Trichonephila clavipes]|nr:hypothetical protein TNCV_1128231 [Trichonephila clavipes]